MYVNLYENHLSYINDFSKYAQKYRCTTCDRHFKKSSDLHRHQRVCSNKTKFLYPGGFHKAQESIFDRLDQYEIRVPEDERTFELYICYDFEALLQNVHDQSTEFLHWTAKHVPISVSICSNEDGFTEPMCFVEPDQDQLVQSMVSRMSHIADRVYELAQDKWNCVFQAIDDKIVEDDEGILQQGQSCEFNVLNETTEGDPERKLRHPLCKLYGQMETYMSQVLVLGFSSAKYNINLIKRLNT